MCSTTSEHKMISNDSERNDDRVMSSRTKWRCGFARPSGRSSPRYATSMSEATTVAATSASIGRSTPLPGPTSNAISHLRAPHFSIAAATTARREQWSQRRVGFLDA